MTHSQYARIVWYEGMTLDPHHFQQWDRYSQANLNTRIRSVAPFDWGFLELSIDKEALTNGIFSLVRAKGITPDGLVFRMPDGDLLPQERNFQELFPATAEHLEVFLSIPAERLGGRNCLLPDAAKKRETRFTADSILLNDDNTGTDEREISVTKTNFQLRFGDESIEDACTLKIAEVVRLLSGGFALSDTYIPPCLSFIASDILTAMVRRLLEVLVVQSSSLWEQRRQRSSGQVDVTASDVNLLSRLHTINTFIPLLNHHYSVTGSHPEEIYTIMLALAGQLAAFSMTTEVNPRDFPLYDHGNLTDCFVQLETQLRALMEEEVSAHYITIPLEKSDEGFLTGKIEDDDLLESAKFFLITTSDIPESRLVNELPHKIRIAAPDNIRAVLQSAIRALPIGFIPRPPIGLPAREGILYFTLEKEGLFWESICRAHMIALFLPSELAEVQLELVAILPD